MNKNKITVFNLSAFLVAFLLLSSISVNANESHLLLAGGDDAYAPFAEVMPEPVDGMVALIKKVKYPAIAVQAGIEGKVYVMALINENGTVDNVKIIKGLGAGCDEEVINVVKGAKFKPGTNKGVPVKVKMSLAFTFKLAK